MSETSEKNESDDDIEYQIITNCINEHNLQDTEEAKSIRNSALSTVTSIVEAWATKAYNSSEKAQNISKYVRVVPFGSCSLQLESPNSDLDLVCCVFEPITRSSFFSGLYNLLQTSRAITNITAASNAYVPSIKFSCNNVAIDLLFVSFAPHAAKLPHFPDVVDWTDPVYFNQASVSDLRAFAGISSCMELVQIIRQANPTHGMQLFSMLGRCVKYWAKSRHMYGNIVGFLGGISWCILITFIIKKHPNATEKDVGVLFRDFFTTFGNWPRSTPVTVCPILGSSNTRYAYRYGIDRPWSVFSSRGPLYLPIITPSYPATNTSYNLQIAGSQTLRQELYRAEQIMQKVQLLLASSDTIEIKNQRIQEQYNLLFAAFNPASFTKLAIRIQCSTFTASDMIHWQGFVQSKIRMLADDGCAGTILLRPEPECIHRTGCLKEFVVYVMKAGPSLEPWQQTRIPSSACISNFYRLCQDRKFTNRSRGMVVKASVTPL